MISSPRAREGFSFNGSDRMEAFILNGPIAALHRSLVSERTRAPGAVGPGFQRCRRYAKPPAATLLTGLAGGERLSQCLLQLVCPFLFWTLLPRARIAVTG